MEAFLLFFFSSFAFFFFFRCDDICHFIQVWNTLVTVKLPANMALGKEIFICIRVTLTMTITPTTTTKGDDSDDSDEQDNLQQKYQQTMRKYGMNPKR